MKNSPLIDKSKAFALEIIKVCNTVKQTKKETVLTNQLIYTLDDTISTDVVEFKITKNEFAKKLHLEHMKLIIDQQLKQKVYRQVRIKLFLHSHLKSKIFLHQKLP